MRTNIIKTSMELFQSPPKNCLRYKYPRTYLSLLQIQPIGARPYTRHVILNRSDVKSFYGSGTAPWKFSDIGAHLEFQKPEFLMPDLLLNNYGYYL